MEPVAPVVEALTDPLAPVGGLVADVTETVAAPLVPVSDLVTETTGG